MTAKTSDKGSSRNSNGSEGAANPQSGVLPSLPVTTLADALPQLRRPFAPPAVKWKTQSVLRGERGLIVGYVDVRLVEERLDLVCGGEWEMKLEPFRDQGDILASLTIFGRTRENVGAGSFAMAAASTAKKRAASMFGVGASLYATPTRILASTEKGDLDGDGVPTLKRVKDRKGKTQLWITKAAEQWLRGQYSVWLLGEGETRFGEAFDHGTAIDTIGDAADEGLRAEGDGPEPAERKQEIEAAYKAAVAAGAQKSKFTKGRFEAALRGAESDEQLDELEQKVAEFANA